MRLYSIKKHKLLVIVVTVITVVSIGWLFYAPYGINNYSNLNSEIDKVSAEINTLQAQNDAMSEEIIKLQGDSQYLEDIARKEFGLLKKNEMVFEFKSKK